MAEGFEIAAVAAGAAGLVQFCQFAFEPLVNGTNLIYDLRFFHLKIKYQKANIKYEEVQPAGLSAFLLFYF